jgi:RNA polymerase sigma factor (sigma-70 family)
MGKQPQTLAQALASLPEEERVVLTMHYLKSMSAADIASLLGVPERSVEAIIRQGKSRLSAILGLQG